MHHIVPLSMCHGNNVSGFLDARTPPLVTTSKKMWVNVGRMSTSPSLLAGSPRMHRLEGTRKTGTHPHQSNSLSSLGHLLNLLPSGSCWFVGNLSEIGIPASRQAKPEASPGYITPYEWPALFFRLRTSTPPPTLTVPSASNGPFFLQLPAQPPTSNKVVAYPGHAARGNTDRQTYRTFSVSPLQFPPSAHLSAIRRGGGSLTAIIRRKSRPNPAAASHCCFPTCSYSN
ncbi:uncharacterized protein CLUP02_13948 [Colletotrichum lupini]|uniref:Uncharacterized protein n=1 Tax=Colletotrichum lupini TaxID=145971 RepID=A0A9Q8T333_9PEZI|nr:uncharacterized protein CLUP02_13948 [Colletotrichum lupini]UQC88424.1 hypothetical protein CLUP02_13948 [Colletotrichum lupini]